MRRARVAAALALGAGAVVCAASAPACSLGLDDSLIDAGRADTSVPSGDDGAGPTPPADAPVDAVKPAVDAASCANDNECTSLSACRAGHCVGGRCTYTVCPTAVCQGSTCLSATNTCSAVTSYGFHAGAVHVGAGSVGCGGDAQRCLAAAFPFVFVGTANGVVAYAMNDPSNDSPPTVPVTGLPFLPYAIVGVGSRVYFVGNVAGSGPTYKLPLAWIDVPSDPMITGLAVTTVLESYSQPGPAVPLAATGGGLYLLNLDAAKFFPAALVNAPLKDGATITSFPSPGVPDTARPVVASGARFAFARWASDANVYATWLGFVTGAATTNAQSSAEVSAVPIMGPTTPESTYAQGDDGSVIWGTGAAIIDDAGASVIRAARFAWLVGDGKASAFDPKANLDVEQYSPPLGWGTRVAGPIAWVDASTALVLAADAAALTQTSVQVAVKTPTPQLAQGRRYVVPIGVGQVGAAASGGFAYVLAADSPDSATLHAFAPACAQ